MIGFFSSRGTHRIVVYVLRDNEGMRGLAKSLGFVVDANASDADALNFVLTLSKQPEPSV